VRLAALRDPAVKLILPELGKKKNATNEKARRVLGWSPRTTEESIVATAESLVRLGLLKDSAKPPRERDRPNIFAATIRRPSWRSRKFHNGSDPKNIRTKPAR
jgi:hypothetical protein